MTYPEHGEYRHFKGGKYMVEHSATMSTTNLEMDQKRVVLYYKTDEDGYRHYFVRPATEFSDMVDWPDGTRKRRFEPIPNVCEECGGSLGGYDIGRLQEHKGNCSRIPF